MKKLLLCCIAFLFVAGCSGQGTEVLNPSTSTYTNAKYQFTLDMSDEWTLTELTPSNPAGDNIYTDPIGTAESLALFEKENTDLLILADTLTSNQSLSDYVSLRHISDDTTSSATIDGFSAIIVNQAAAGSNNGQVIFKYIDRTTFVLIFRIEIVASSAAEEEEIETEFNNAIEEVENTSTTGIKQIRAAHNHNLVLMSDGTLYCWGRNSEGECGQGNINEEKILAPQTVPSIDNISYVTGGEHNSLAITTNGQAYGWGSNGLGNPTGNTDDVLSPTLFSIISDIKFMETGPGTNYVVTTNNDVKSWGCNIGGRLGDGTTEDQSSPVDVIDLDGLSIKQLATGSHASTSAYTAILTTDGDVYYWASNDYSTPQKVEGLSNIVAIDMGAYLQIALKSDGTVYTWTGITSTQVSSLADIIAVSAGGYHAMALKYDGTVYFKGKKTFFGSEFQDFTLLSDINNVSTISSGNAHALFLKNDGTVWTLGSNSNGELGQGVNYQTLNNSETALQVTGF